MTMTLGELLDQLHKLHDQEGIPMDTEVQIRAHGQSEPIHAVVDNEGLSITIIAVN